MNQHPDAPGNDARSPTESSQALNTLPEERTNAPINAPFTDHSTAYAQDEDDESFDWQRLFATVKRRRKVIGLTLLVVLATAGTYLALSPKIYRASADLLVNTEQKSGSNPLAGSLPAISSLLDATGARSLDTEVEILRSSSVQDAATALMPTEARSNLASPKKGVQVDIQPKRSTDIISVSVQSRDPKLAIAYSNAVCEAYRLQNQKNNTAQYKETAEYVGGQLKTVRENLDKKRDELRKFKEANDIVDLPTEAQARVERLNELQAALQQAEAERASGEAQLKNLREQTAGMAPSETAPSTISVRPIVQQLRRQLTDLEAQRSAALEEFVPTASEVKTLDNQIAGLRRRLETEAETEVETYTNNINPVRQAATLDISKILAAVRSAQARAEGLRENIASARQTVQKLPQREYQLSQLQGDLATYQQTFQSLSDKYQTLLISQQTPVANARVITPADEATKVSPRVGSTLVLALFGGLVLSMVLAMLIESLDNRIYTEESAVQITGLPVLTHVPLLKSKNDQPVLIGKDDASVLLESFRMLRTQLSFIGSYGQLRTIVLTSSQPGEGKSTVSANLAIALALNKKKVVLVDTDLRRPTVHKIFGVTNNKGFTNVVAERGSLKEAMHTTDIEGLFLLTSGPKPPNPAELLDSRMARGLIEHLKEQFDYVIIDAPPALMMADAQIISSSADGVLLVISCQEARRGGVERTHELMAQAGIRVVGMVLNKFTHEQGGYYDYYGSGYKEYLSEPELTEGSANGNSM